MVQKNHYIFIILYILVVFLLNYFLTKRKSEAQLKNKVDIKNMKPALALYCYSNSNINRLFWITLIDLIERNYYKLYKEKETLYIKHTEKDFNNKNLKSFEKRVVSYINEVIDKEEKNACISVDMLSNLISTDWNYTSKLATFGKELKKDVLNKFNIKESFRSFIFPAILTCLYAFQVSYCIDFDFMLSTIIIISIPFTLLSLLIADNFKNRIPLLTRKKAIRLFIVSLILSVVAFYVWQVTSNSDYIMIHVVLGLLTFMYPLLILIDINLMKTVNYKYNALEKNVVDQMVNLKKELIDKNELNPRDYVYSLGLNLKKKCSNSIYNEFKNIMDI